MPCGVEGAGSCDVMEVRSVDGRLYSGENITVRSPRCIPWRLVAARGQPDHLNARGCAGVSVAYLR